MAVQPNRTTKTAELNLHRSVKQTQLVKLLGFFVICQHYKLLLVPMYCCSLKLATTSRVSTLYLVSDAAFV